MNDASPTRTADRVEDEIVRTRDELDHTLDVLGERFSAQELRQQAGDYVQQGLKRAGERIRRNPGEAAVAATLLLLGWLTRRWYRSRVEQRRAEQFAAAVLTAFGMPATSSAPVKHSALGHLRHLPAALTIGALARPLLHAIRARD
jgi:hypothetical protein